jgi:hypothetical protein
LAPRLASVLVAALVLVSVAACGADAGAPPSASPSAVAAVPPTPVPPTPTPVPVPSPTTIAPTPSLNAGDVDGSGAGPQLTVEFPDERLLDVTLEDAQARAWRVVVRGTGAHAADRLEIVVEAGDVAPGITATEIQDDVVTATTDLGGFDGDTATAGACHGSLEVCVDGSSFTFADDASGRLRIRLEMPDPSAAALLVTGGTAGWPGEPFVLGPWTDTETFPWGEG